MNFLRTSTLLLLAALAFPGCRRDEVRSYTAKKDAPPAHYEGDGHDHSAPGHSHGPARPAARQAATWTLPAGWETQTSSIRGAAKFTLPTREPGERAEAAIIPIAGEAPKADVLNVLRRDIQLEDLSEADWTKLAEAVDIGGAKGELYRMTSEASLIAEKFKARVLIGVARNGDTTWFARLSGSEALVSQQEAAFVGFLKSLKFQDAAPEATATGGESKPQWTVPAGWREQPPGMMQLAKFAVGADGPAGAVMSVSRFDGDGGGLLQNVVRWRGQLGLGPVGEAELPGMARVLDIAGARAHLVDFTGKDAKTGAASRMLAASVERSGESWFYKLMGDATTVEAQREAFVEFVKGVKYR